MAEDLTPHPPAVDVEPWTPAPTHHHADEPIVEHVAVRQRSYGGRFALAYGVLGIVAGFAIAAIVITSQLSSPEPAAKWSAWMPQAGSPTAVATDIADHVAPLYRLPNGSELVAITASVPKFQGVQLAAVAVQPDKGAVDQNIRVVDAAKTIQYQLCGLGKQCAIASGKPSAEREWLLRREAFELALYTFQYDPGVDTVLAFLPPKPGKSPDVTMFFEKANYAKQLSQPLAATIPTQVPGLTAIPFAEGKTIDALTAPQRYGFQVQQLQDGSPVIVLNAVSPK